MHWFIARPTRWKRARWQRQVQAVLALEDPFADLSESELSQRSSTLRYQAKRGESLDTLLPDAFALVREAAARQLSMRHYPVQILGGIAIHHGAIAEMETGEGKTLTATLPLYLNALAGKGAHLATANDYLADRDADWMRPVYEQLGLTVGAVVNQMPRSQRAEAYVCDITYGSAKEFGFDFLRDRLLLRRAGRQDGRLGSSLFGQDTDFVGQPVQRHANFALVDEADSLLIDEARTPLIISAAPTDDTRTQAECFRWSAEVAAQFHEDQHYFYDPADTTVDLTPAGRQLVRSLSKPDAMRSLGLLDINESVERAIKVDRDFVRDRHYVVRDGAIVIVDEFTGRLAEGRKWRGGIHQAIEAKENVEVTIATGQAAQITIQELFSRYDRLAGMTGTATSSARELRKVYGTPVVSIPTNRPSQRTRLPDKLLVDAAAKWTAVVEEVAGMHELGRPVLIGTRSIDKSEHLSELLRQANLEHRLLHAKQLADEADVIAEAGLAGRITVATNMAGRGTDIRLGGGVAELGGLHVIGTEMHDASRIDRQLAGRCARQGDPGSFRQFLALDDDILATGLGRDKADQVLQVFGSAVQIEDLGNLFRKAQRTVERKHFRDRQILMHFMKNRIKTQSAMGQDPYLDTADGG